MIRFIYLLRRLPHLSLGGFQSYWLNAHGPLVAKNQRALSVRRYVQSHTIEDPLTQALRDLRPGMEAPYDGVASLWWDSLDRFMAAAATPEGLAAAQELLEDERKFIDLSRSALWLSMEVPQINPMPENGIVARTESAIVKAVYALRRLPGMSREACQRHWLMNHGGLARTYGAAMGFLRYIQSHTIEDAMNEALRETRGARETYDGLTEVWCNRYELAQVMNTPESEGLKGLNLCLEDEKKFIDFSRSAIWLAKEHVFVDG